VGWLHLFSRSNGPNNPTQGVSLGTVAENRPSPLKGQSRLAEQAGTATSIGRPTVAPFQCLRFVVASLRMDLSSALLWGEFPHTSLLEPLPWERANEGPSKEPGWGLYQSRDDIRGDFVLSIPTSHLVSLSPLRENVAIQPAKSIMLYSSSYIGEIGGVQSSRPTDHPRNLNRWSPGFHPPSFRPDFPWATPPTP